MYVEIKPMQYRLPYIMWVFWRKMKFDFIRFCADYNIETRNDIDGWIQIECPICGHSGTRGFKGGFNIAGGYYNCWACGGHSIKEVIKELLNISWKAVDDILQNYKNESTIIKIKEIIKYAQNVTLPFDELNKIGKTYVIKRNYSCSLIEKKYKVVGVPMIGQWAGRLIIPIFYNNKLVSYQGRSILSKERCNALNILRYKTLDRKLSVIDPKHILYNLDNCIKKYCAVVEGAFDAWRIGDNCAATLGTSTTPEQILLLTRRFEKIFLLFDPEKEAQERAEKLAVKINALKKNNPAEIIDTELGHDPGDMTEKEISYLKKELNI